MNKKQVSLAVVVMLLMATGIWGLARSNSSVVGESDINSIFSSKYAVKDLAENGFGALKNLSAQSNKSEVAKMYATQTGSMPAASPSATSSMMSAPVGSGDAKMIAPGEPYPGQPSPAPDDTSTMPYQPTEYVYKYTGNPLNKVNASQSVYRKAKPRQSEGGLVDKLFKTGTFGLLDLSLFKSAQISNLTISEDVPYGYSVMLDLQYGAASIYPNYPKWPEFSDYKPIKESDLITDGEAMNIANAFLVEKGISRDGLANPIVDSSWRVYYDSLPAGSEEKMGFYIPESVNVVYPFTIEGQSVVDESGGPAGMYVNVDVRTKKVNSVNDITARQYERSSYAGETDTDRIIKLAEMGNYRNFMNPGTPMPYAEEGMSGMDGSNAADSEVMPIVESKKVELELATPTIGTVRIYMMNQSTYSSDEIFVPAYIFQVKNPTEDSQKQVIIPIVKDVLDSASDNQVYPMSVKAE
jgi:hypothetical protein